VWLAAPEDVRKDAHEMWQRRRENGVKRVLGPDFAANNGREAFLYKQIRLINENGPNRLRTDDQVQRLRALERDLTASATREALSQVSSPVLFIGGEHDEVMPVALMEVAASLIPAARMTVVQGAAHSVYFEKPADFNEIVLAFLRECAL
jgi:pimeloyl-ACP methyl ester carboxylesterase